MVCVLHARIVSEFHLAAWLATHTVKYWGKPIFTRYLDSWLTTVVVSMDQNNNKLVHFLLYV